MVREEGIPTRAEGAPHILELKVCCAGSKTNSCWEIVFYKISLCLKVGTVSFFPFFFFN